MRARVLCQRGVGGSLPHICEKKGMVVPHKEGQREEKGKDARAYCRSRSRAGESAAAARTVRLESAVERSLSLVTLHSTIPKMATHRDAKFPSTPYIDPAPAPKNVPHVDELGTTSAPLKSASFFIGEHCKDYNGA